MELDVLKTKIIARVKAHYSENVIYPIYPEAKQRNALFGIWGTEQERTDMLAFINAKRTEIDEIEALVSELVSTEILDEFVPPQIENQDHVMRAFIVEKLGSGLNDDQLLIVAIAVQNIKLLG